MILKVVHDSESKNPDYLTSYYYENSKYLLGFSCGNLDDEEWYKKNIDVFLATLDLEKQGLSLTEYSYLNTFVNGENTKYDHEITGRIEYKGVSLKYNIEIFFIDDILSFKVYSEFPEFITSKEIKFRDCSVITSDSISNEDCYHSLYPVNTVELMFGDPLLTQLNSDASVVHHVDEIVEYCKKKAIADMKSKQSKDKLVFVNIVKDQKLYLSGVSNKISKLTDGNQNKYVYDEEDKNPPLFSIDNEILRTSNVYTATDPVEIKLFEIDANPARPYLINLELWADLSKSDVSHRLISIDIVPNIGSNLDMINTVYAINSTAATSYMITLFFDDNMKQLIKLGLFKDFKDYLIRIACEKAYQDTSDIESDYENFCCIVTNKEHPNQILAVDTVSKMTLPYIVPKFKKGTNVFISYDKRGYYASDLSLMDDGNNNYLIYVFNDSILREMNMLLSSSDSASNSIFKLRSVNLPKTLVSRVKHLMDLDAESKQDESYVVLDSKDKVDQLIKDIKEDKPKDSNTKSESIQIPV